MSDSFYTSILTSRTSIILTYSPFNLEKDKNNLYYGNWNFLFFTLRVTQTTIQLKNKYIVDCTTRNFMFCTFYIAGCTTRNIKLFLDTLRVSTTRNTNFFLNTLRVVQPAMY